MDIEMAKGVRDFNSDEKILRNEIVTILQQNFEEFGFLPIETPIIERFDVLSSKYTGGDEILKETFKFKDQGERELGLRYDLTVPLARFAAMNPNLKKPFKRYQIERVFRDGPIKLGRYREFWQCDGDILGSKSMRADATCIELLKQGFQKLNIPITININNRKILDSLVEKSGIEKTKEAILSLDKLKKIGSEEVIEEMISKGINEDNARKLLDLANLEGTNEEKIKFLKNLIPECEGIKEIEQILEITEANFDVSLARGLSYYTGTIFEVYANNGPIKGSLAAGGRYDKMISNLSGKEEVPAVGASFGLEPITEYLKFDKKELKKSNTLVFIIPIGNTKESFEIAKQLRAEKIKTDIDLSEKSISKNLQFANYYGIPFCLIIGEKELKENKYTLKNMKTGVSESHTIKGLIKFLKEI